jgi:tRNA pseudouridine55 synthase
MPGPGARTPRRRVDGVLLLDKPAGLSSNAALQRAKRLFCAEKAGHTGTLDPLATGLLPICFGEATKFAHGLLDAGKTYDATIRFGTATTTGDAEGEVTRESPMPVERASIEAILPRFIGTVQQVPPRHSALKFKGRNYYEYARAGIEIPRTAREVSIYGMELVTWTPPLAQLRVACGKGTYIRVLAEDLGTAVGSCAHLSALRRTATGPFVIAGAVTLEALEDLDVDARDALLLPAHAAAAELPCIVIDAEGARALFEGKIARAPTDAAGRYRGFDACGRFLGVVEIDDNGMRVVRLTRMDAQNARLKTSA